MLVFHYICAVSHKKSYFQDLSVSLDIVDIATMPENQSLVFATSSDINQPVVTEKKAISLKF